METNWVQSTTTSLTCCLRHRGSTDKKGASYGHFNWTIQLGPPARPPDLELSFQAPQPSHHVLPPLQPGASASRPVRDCLCARSPHVPGNAATRLLVYNPDDDNSEVAVARMGKKKRKNEGGRNKLGNVGHSSAEDLRTFYSFLQLINTHSQQ